jgi:hypothetical protein
MRKHNEFRILAALVPLLLFGCGSRNASAPAAVDAAAGADGVTYYVATNGSDENPGAFAMPWRTLQHAAETVRPGDTVLVRGGTYNERLVLRSSGAENAFLTFENFPGETPVLSGEGLTLSETDAENALIALCDVSYVRIRGIAVTNYVSTDERVPCGIRISGAGRSIELIRCTVSGIRTVYGASGAEQARNAHGIAVYGTDGRVPLDGVVIDHCEVYGNALGGSEAVALNGNFTNLSVTNNSIHDNENIGIDCIGFEGTAPANDRARNGICSGNEVENISSAGNPAYSGVLCAVGIYIDGGQNIVVEGNRIQNCDIGVEPPANTSAGARNTS